MRLERVTIQGFRSFSEPAQVVDLSPTLTVIYADNSQGKTSFAEALEFLLTGTISRRTFTGSATREFAECIRNAHLSGGIQAFVEGVFVSDNGERHTLRRVLESDFASNRDCVSTLTLDGVPVEDPSVVVALSEPPLQTPILLQHSLRYVLSAKPQDRATYFKAILDITALDRVHDHMVAVATALAPQPTLLQRRVLALLPEPALRGSSPSPTEGTVAVAICEAIRASLQLPTTLEPERVAAEAEATLSRQANARFPFGQVDIATDAPPELPTAAIERLKQAAGALVAGAEANAALLKLLESAEPLLPVEPTGASDCPLCEGLGTLSVARVEAIRRTLLESQELRAATTTFRNEQQAVLGWVEAVSEAVSASTPSVARGASPNVLEAVRMAALALLIGGDSPSQLDAWLSSVEQLKEAAGRLEQLVSDARAAILSATPVAVAQDMVIDQILAVAQELPALASAQEQYKTAYSPVRAHIVGRIATIEALSTPRELLALLPAAAEIAADVTTHARRTKAVQDLQKAAEEVREATKRVLDDKFEALSDDIGSWWNLLRPDELSNFSGVQRAGSGRRFLDVKAGLQPSSGVAAVVERDAVAVFSDSQLNCLGLSSFLARITRENASFVVLDDPIQASDEEHRYTFIRSVPDALLAAGRQVIILTHDQLLVRDLQDLYAHRDPTRIQIIMETPQLGSKLVVLRDSLEIQLTRAHNLTQSTALEPRRRASQLLRNEAERFCKTIMVQSRRRAGETDALLSDYENQNLDPLIALAAPVLLSDPAHSGKLRAVARALNPGNHDDGVPSSAALRAAIGDLRTLVSAYL